MSLLKDDEIRRSLNSLSGWRQMEGAIERQFEFPDFSAALAFVNRTGELAEAANHHPDIDIRWNKVRLVLLSHDAGGLTERDFRLAAEINRLPESLTAGTGSG